MKSILFYTIFSLTITNTLAQKTYIDPNSKEKKGLLEPGEKATTQVPPTANEKETAATKLTPDQLRYCSCIDYTRALEQKISVAQNLYKKGVMTWDDAYKVERDSELEKYNGLVKKFETTNDIDPDSFECDVKVIEANKPKDFKKHLDEYDRTCKFKEIERKTL